METKIRIISPSEARGLLGKNCQNRSIRKTRVEELKELIKTGAWELTHQGIAFDELGQLLDGQHRLTAIAEGTISVPVMVTTGLSASTFSAIDRGLSRTMSDILAPGDSVKARAIEMASTALRIARDKTRRNTPAEIQEVLNNKIKSFLPVIEIYKSFRVFSSAPVRLAAAGWHEIHPEYVRDIFIALCREDFSTAPRMAGVAFSRLVKSGQRGQARQAEAFAIGCSLFDPSKHENTKIQVDDVYSFKHVMRAWLDGATIKEALKTRNRAPGDH